MALCPHCNSVHPPSHYAKGFFLLGEGDEYEVVEVAGEGEVLRRARRTGLDKHGRKVENPDFLSGQVFWTEEAVNAEISSKFPEDYDTTKVKVTRRKA